MISGDAMSERDDYEPGVPCWIDTLQPDPDAAMAFYAALFAWEFAGPGQMPGDQPGRYFVARLRGRDVAGIGSQPAGEWSPPSAWSTYVSVASADEAALAAVDAGGEVLVEPFDVLPAGRMAVVADPAGAPFCVWQPGERRGAQLLNEPGAWAMSHLSTPDPERAGAPSRPRPPSPPSPSPAPSSAGRRRPSARVTPRSPCSACPATSAASPSSRSRARWWRPCPPRTATARRAGA